MSYTNLLYHLDFATKERVPYLKPDHLARVGPYIGGIVRELGGQMLAANGAPDHIHIAVQGTPTVPVADLVRVIKANSSKWIHETFPGLAPFAWQEGYAAFSVSASVMPKVLDYIRGQQQHHQKADFKQEFIVLLKKHGIPYDERFVWG
ncbi:MAG: IS200/IS605 family transposase [Planctomycetes bacterium]|nr:IS200/IS605 family transposase [Planctomycetota bacterium]